MHLDLRGDIWVYPYTDFYLARVSTGTVEVVVDKRSVEHKPLAIALYMFDIGCTERGRSSSQRGDSDGILLRQ